MKREFSAGGIVFNSKGQVLLINNAALKDPTKSYWGFPKGHVMDSESSKDAALREVMEEVGINAVILEKIGDSKYVFTQNGQKIFKVVTIYLMESTDDNLTPQKDELLEAGWFEPEEALEKISFKNDIQHLKKAMEIMEVSS